MISAFVSKALQNNQLLEFHSLQVNNTNTTSEFTVHTHDNFLNDFADTAALISSLDLVISIDTSISHLSGALNKETILLLPEPPDYLSPRTGDKTPWYPNTFIIRQSIRNSWNEPLELLLMHLCNKLSQQKPLLGIRQ